MAAPRLGGDCGRDAAAHARWPASTIYVTSDDGVARRLHGTVLTGRPGGGTPAARV
ncbi:MAG TPA: hypothetical protein VHN80_15615 [Kineosporiaceae bacterium]|nr:hypothetical protein [Kineosporiaceae bacterium]